MLKSVNHTSFTVSDAERSVKFYTELLGMKLISLEERPQEFCEKVTGIPGARMKIAYVEGAGYKIELIQYLSPPGEKLDTRNNNVGSAHLCYNVDNLMEMCRDLGSKGVRFRGEPATVNAGPNKGGLVVYLLDPDDNNLEFIQPPSN
jgi:catechol 2,3-dioxygenase-like lactoylglutathione lyase family enzyme